MLSDTDESLIILRALPSQLRGIRLTCRSLMGSRVDLTYVEVSSQVMQKSLDLQREIRGSQDSSTRIEMVMRNKNDRRTVTARIGTTKMRSKKLSRGRIFGDIQKEWL